MKKIFFSFLLSGCCWVSIAQSSVGLIAHWDMNGTTNDVSGGGHNGHSHNITPAAGSDGVLGHGYYFNGINSWISVPYSPNFNVSNFSICATVKVMGFYSGTCHVNVIFLRGKTSIGNCVYSLQLDDQAAGISCSALVDSSVEDFVTEASAPSAALSPGTTTVFAYTPYIIKNTWYKVITTFNDTSFKMYVNGTLKNVATIANVGLPMGTGTDSISIGYDLKEASAGYPYPFNGIIDDIRLYNRVLSDSEVTHYGDTCGTITAQPATSSTHVGGNATYTVNTTIAGATYQWQQDGGTGYVNLSNSGPYSGVYTNTLTITGVTAAITGDHYRCLISNSWGCADTTVQALLTTGLENITFSDLISISPNPAVNIVTIDLHVNEGTIQFFNQVGQMIREEKITNKLTAINLSTLPSGMYIFKIVSEGNVAFKKIIKY